MKEPEHQGPRRSGSDLARPVEPAPPRPGEATGHRQRSLTSAQAALGNAAVARRLRREGVSRQEAPGTTPPAQAAPTPAAGEARGGQPLPEPVRAPLEHAFGRELSAVRIHQDEAAARLTREYRAQALTTGTDIHFAPGQYAPGTAEGNRLLAHELTHVLQHQSGRSPEGVSRPSDPTEQEAYANEERILSRLPQGLEAARPGGATAPPPPPAPETLPPPREEAPAGPEPAPRAPSSEEASAAPRAEREDEVPSVHAEAPPEEEAGFQTGLPAPPASTPEEAPTAVAAGPAPAEAGVPEPEAAPAPEPPGAEEAVEADPRALAAGATVRAAALAHAAQLEGAATRGLGAVTASESTALSGIEAARGQATARLEALFAGKLAELEAATRRALDAIEASRAEQARAITTHAAAQSARLEGEVGARRSAAAELAGQAARRILDAGEEEAGRAVTESERRAQAALALAEGFPGSGDAPRREAQQETARRIATTAADQCRETGLELASQARASASEVATRVDGFLTQYLASVDEAAEQGHERISTQADEALSQVDARAEEARAATEELGAQGRATLLARQDEALGMLATVCDGAGARVREAGQGARARLEPQAAEVVERFHHYGEEAAASFRTVVGAEPDAVAEAEGRCLAELDAAATEALGALAGIEAEAAQRLDGLRQDFQDGLDGALSSTDADASAAVEQLTARLEERSTRTVTHLGELGASARDALTESAEVATAELERAAQAFLEQAELARDELVDGLREELDKALAWEDARVDECRGHIADATGRIGSRYEELKQEAHSRSEDGAARPIQRSVWDSIRGFFADLAASAFLWFQNTFGDFWGTLLGGFVALVIAVFGAVAMVVTWVVFQAINLVWGFVWGESVFDVPLDWLFVFIGDVVAGIVVWGDLRDIFKHVILKWIRGEEITWVDWFIAGMSVLGIILTVTAVGAVIAAIVKSGGKATFKSIIKALVKELGAELANKLLKELAPDVAEALVKQLGKELIQHLAKELGGAAIKELADKLSREALEHLAKELGGKAIKELADNIAAETLEHLARNLGGGVLHKLSQELGGTAIKELVDSLGRELLEKLAKELGGTAIKNLHDTLGKTLLEHLAKDLGGKAIQELAGTLSKATLEHLAKDLSGTTIKQLVDKLGTDAASILDHLAKDLTGAVTRELVEKLDKSALKALTSDLTGLEIKQLLDDLAEKALNNLTQGLTGKEVLELARNHGLGLPFLRGLAEEAGSGQVLKRAATHFGSIADLAKVLKEAETAGAPAKALKNLLDGCVRRGWKKLADLTSYFKFMTGQAASLWDDSLRWAEQFLDVGNGIGKNARVGGGGPPPGVAPGSSAVSFTDAASGTTDNVIVASGDILHYRSGHTWENFALTQGNAKRGPFSNMWPTGITDADIVTDAMAALKDGGTKTLVEGMLASGSNMGNTAVTVGGYVYQVGIERVGTQLRLTQFYPASGGTNIPKDVIRAIVALLSS